MTNKIVLRQQATAAKFNASAAAKVSPEETSPRSKDSSPSVVAVATIRLVALVTAAGRPYVYSEDLCRFFPGSGRLPWPRIGQPGQRGQLKRGDPPDRRASANTLRGAKLRHRRRVIFLEAYRQHGSISAAAGLAGIAPETHAVWLRTSREYAEAFAQAREEFHGEIHENARQRAIGTLTPKYYHGRPLLDPRTGRTYAELERSVELLIILLQVHSPEEHAPRRRTVPTLPVERIPARVNGRTFEELLAAQQIPVMSQGW